MAPEGWKLIEHRDEFNMLGVFQQIAAATIRKAEGQGQ
jgi:hypothetical protein